MSIARQHIFSALIAVALTSPKAALCQTPSVDALMEHGATLRSRGRDEQALGEFRRAYAIGQAPRALAQIALAEQALGRWLQAETDLQTALRAAQDPAIVRFQSTLREALATIERHLGNITVECDVPGASVMVDNHDEGRVPLARSVRVAAGSHTVVIQAEGRQPITREVSVAGGRTERVEVHLPPADASRSQRATQQPGRLADWEATNTQPPTIIPPDNPGGTQRVLGWVSLVAGVAGVVVGVVGVVGRQGAVADAERYPGCTVSTCSANIRSSFDTGKTLEYGGFIAGGIFAVTGVLLLATVPSRPVNPSQAHTSWGSGPGDIGVSFSTTF